jgi:hypothetical protein
MRLAVVAHLQPRRPERRLQLPAYFVGYRHFSAQPPSILLQLV